MAGFENALGLKPEPGPRFGPDRRSSLADIQQHVRCAWAIKRLTRAADVIAQRAPTGPKRDPATIGAPPPLSQPRGRRPFHVHDLAYLASGAQSGRVANTKPSYLTATSIPTQRRRHQNTTVWIGLMSCMLQECGSPILRAQKGQRAQECFVPRVFHVRRTFALVVSPFLAAGLWPSLTTGRRATRHAKGGKLGKAFHRTTQPSRAMHAVAFFALLSLPYSTIATLVISRSSSTLKTPSPHHAQPAVLQSRPDAGCGWMGLTSSLTAV